MFKQTVWVGLNPSFCFKHTHTRSERLWRQSHLIGAHSLIHTSTLWHFLPLIFFFSPYWYLSLFFVSRCCFCCQSCKDSRKRSSLVFNKQFMLNEFVLDHTEECDLTASHGFKDRQTLNAVQFGGQCGRNDFLMSLNSFFFFIVFQ